MTGGIYREGAIPITKAVGEAIGTGGTKRPLGSDWFCHRGAERCREILPRAGADEEPAYSQGDDLESWSRRYGVYRADA